MSVVKDWKFKLGGTFVSETTKFGEEIKQIAVDLKLPENALALAKVHIMQTGYPTCEFHWLGIQIELPTDQILSFNPFYRAVDEGQGGAGGQQAFYQLSGKEYALTPLKKNLI